MADQQQTLAGGFSKRHVSGMLKFLDNEEKREKALAVAAVYKKRFASKEWAQVMANLRQVANEDQLRVVRRRPAPLKRNRPPGLETSASAPVKTPDVTTPPVGLPRYNSAQSLLSAGRNRAVSTPRERWDIMSRGPSTPLTPTPVGNAFAQGGFWEQLTPKTPAPPTPVTVIPYSPISPVVPMDHEAREVYNDVKAQGEAIARSVCATRMSKISKISNSDDIPRSLLTSKDLLKGALIMLEYKQAPLKTIMNPNLPKMLKDLEDDEAKIIEQYSINDTLELLDLDNWLLVDEQARTLTTLLDAQRETLQMHRHRRKSSLLHLPEEAVQQAWATRILEDAQRAVEADGDNVSDDSDPDKGYNYNNFMRSIKHEYSSSSDCGSLAGGPSYTDLTTLRSSTSPKRPYGSLSLRSRNNSPSPEKRPSIAAANRGLSRITTNIEEEDEGEDTPSAQLSPEERAFRRKGALPSDLNSWAQQLKDMEERQMVNRDHVMGLQHSAFRTNLLNRRGSAGSNESWTCEEAMRHEHESSRMITAHPPSPSTSQPAAPQSTSPLLDFRYSIPMPPGFRYAANRNALPSEVPRRRPHVRGRGSGVRAEKDQNKESEWEEELVRMESRERDRQVEEGETNIISSDRG
ncbi:hypothetical protein DE146DRAFT_179357 [Phaeosphaeria sp. MPI-PUGE-AT-0046c]|nr:hypothetical protein DE146DRAFT_179357 [Phaeosphaeria sp. MPI-PUGE-AT-0046c]